MGRESESTPALARASHLSWPLRYGGALLAVVTGAGFWMLSSLIHRDPFAVFILGVIFTARFLGVGPAVFGTAPLARQGWLRRSQAPDLCRAFPARSQPRTSAFSSRSAGGPNSGGDGGHRRVVGRCHL